MFCEVSVSGRPGRGEDSEKGEACKQDLKGSCTTGGDKLFIFIGRFLDSFLFLFLPLSIFTLSFSGKHLLSISHIQGTGETLWGEQAKKYIVSVSRLFTV